SFAEQTTCAARANSLGQQLLARPVQSNEQVFFADRKPAANLVGALVLQHAQVHHVAQPGRQGVDSREGVGEELALLGELGGTRLGTRRLRRRCSFVSSWRALRWDELSAPQLAPKSPNITGRSHLRKKRLAETTIPPCLPRPSSSPKIRPTFAT